MRRRLETLGDARATELPETCRFLLRDQAGLSDRAGERLAGYDAVIDEGLAGRRTKVRLPAAIPGIDRRAASAIVIEPGPDISVFPSARRCAAAPPGSGSRPATARARGNAARGASARAAGRCARCRSSARGRRPGAATASSGGRGCHKAPAVRRGCRRATVATARKMLRIIHRMLLTGEPCHDPGTGHEALPVMRNAPRRSGMLRKHGMPDAVAARPAA